MKSNVVLGLDFFIKFFENKIDKEKSDEFSEFLKTSIKNSDFVYTQKQMVKSQNFLKTM